MKNLIAQEQGTTLPETEQACAAPQVPSESAPSEVASPSGAFSCSGLVGPLAQRHWKAPFRYDAEGAMIWDARGERAMDVRGWGMLTGKGALGLSAARAEEITQDFGESVVRILNASWPNDSYQPPPGNGAAKQGEHPNEK